jgi:UDP-N-acetylglucosamine acyltransferase
MAEIHATAIIDPRAELGAGVVAGPYVVIRGPVVVGAETVIGAHAVLEGRTTLGEGCRVFPHAVIGTVPQDLKYEGEDSVLEIGGGTTIREFVTVNPGTKASGATIIGRNCLLMACSHVAHDCRVGDNVVMANSSALAGHVEVGEFATIGGLTPVHQFVRIGRHAFLGGMSRVTQDIPPFALVASEPTRVVGVNVVGLQRRGFTPEVINALRRAFHILFKEGLNTSQAVEKIRREVAEFGEVAEVVGFVEKSDRGILK